MFEIDGVLFSLSELQAEATKKNVSFEQFLINNPQIKDVSKQPQRQVKQEPSIAMQQIAVKSVLKTTPGGVLAEKIPGIAGGIIGIGGFLTDFVPGVIDYVERIAPLSPTAPQSKILLAKTMYDVAMNSDDDRSVVDIYSKNLREAGEGIDFSSVYKVADDLYRAKDLISGTFDEQGNKLGVTELLEKGEYSKAATSAIADALTSAPSLALSYAFPVFGSAALGASVAGREFEDRLKEGEQDLANIYLGSTLYGMAEFGTEFAGAKLLRAVNAARAGGMGDNIVKNFLKEGASKYVNFLGNATIAGGLGFTAEGFTELGTSAGQMLTDKYVYDNDVDFMRDWRQLTDAFIIGGLMGGPVTSVSDFSNRVQQSNNKDFVYNFIAPKTQQKKLNKIRYEIASLEQRKNKYKQQGRKDKVQELIDGKKEELQIAESILNGRFDNLTKEELKKYYDNHVFIRNNMHDTRNPKFTESEKKEILEEINTKIKENERILGDDIYNAETEKLLYEVLTDTKIVNDRYNKLKGVNKEDIDIVKITDPKKRPKGMGEAAGLFLDEKGKKPILYIDMKNVVEQEATNVLGHDLLHYVMSRSFKTDNASMAPLVESFKEYLRKSEEGGNILNRIEQRIQAKYTNKDGTLKDGANEEYFTIFSDIISKEKITLDETKIGGIIRNLKNIFDRLVGASNVQLNSGKDIVNFLRNYNDNVNRKNKLLKYNLTSTIDGVKITDNKQTISKQSIDKVKINEGELSEIIDSYPGNNTIETNNDFIQKGGYQSAKVNIQDLGTLDGYLTNLILEDGKIPQQQIPSALQKLKDRIVERIEKNYKPVLDGNRRSLFSYIFGSAASKGKGGIAFRSLQDIKAAVAKAPKTVPVQKQTAEGVEEIQIADDAGIETFVDQSLSEDIDTGISSALQTNLTVDGKRILDADGELAQAIRDTALDIQQELQELGLDPKDPKYRKEYVKIVKSRSKNALKKFRKALDISSKEKYEKFLREIFNKVINNPKALNVSYFVQAERENENKIFAKKSNNPKYKNGRATKQADIRKAVQDGLAFVENEADGVMVYDKLRTTLAQGLPFFLDGERIDGKKTALVTALFMQAVSDATPGVLEVAGYDTGQVSTVLRKIQRLANQKFSKDTAKKTISSQEFQNAMLNFGDGYADLNEALKDFSSNLEILFKNNPDFDIQAALKGRTGQAGEVFFANKIIAAFPGLKVTNISELKQLTLGDTGVDVEIEYKGLQIGVEVKMSIQDRAGSDIKLVEANVKDVNGALTVYSKGIQKDIVKVLKQLGFTQGKPGMNKEQLLKGNFYIVDDINQIRFPKFSKGKLERILEKIKKSRSKVFPIEGAELIRSYYKAKGKKKGKTLDYMYFIGDVGLVNLTNDPLGTKAPDIADLKLDSKVTVTYTSSNSKDGIETLRRRFQLNFVGKPAINGPKFDKLGKLSKQINKKKSVDTKKKDLNLEFNQILEQKTGVEFYKKYKGVKGKRRGKQKGIMNFFIPYTAEDFQGLMYATLPKGEQGNAAMEWMRQNLFRPYSLAMENIQKEQMAIMNDFKAIKKELSNAKAKLDKKILKDDFTNQDAVRVWVWNNAGVDMTEFGLSKPNLDQLIDIVENDKSLKDFALKLIRIHKADGYALPKNDSWEAGNITTDITDSLNGIKREKHLGQWKENVNAIFDDAMFNKLTSIYGKNFTISLKNILKRMETGRNRTGGGDTQIDNYLDWLNNSVGAIMFLNVRSAVLQTISTVNYMNWHDNNPLKAAKAFANQPQFWKDFAMIYNSDYLKIRRGGTKINIAENEIAEAAKKRGVKGAISYLLNKGFVFTRSADSFAIANGGAAMYRNRVNTYLKQGLPQKEAEQKAFSDFRELTEEAQQSSRPDRISKEQAGGFGRVILAFANTPMQYTRLMKRAAQDIANNRGDWKTNWSKLMYYGAVQNFIFNAMQKALFALGFDDEEDEDKSRRITSVAEGMLDSILRGTGVAGNVVMMGKNVAVDVARRSKRSRPNFKDAAWKVLDVSPPLDSKIAKLRSAGFTFDTEMKEIQSMGLTLENPASMAIAQVITAATNVPLDRVMRLYDNTRAAVASDTEAWQRVALLLGWSEWELMMDKDNDKKLTTDGVMTTEELNKKIEEKLKKKGIK
tara:strand:- start:551 stop:6937 length:6387 start_codon:yes stop_codon:yes gene_type:complete